jgi:hypothetical protein
MSNQQLHAELFTSDQRNALGYAVIEARQVVWQTAERAARWADTPDLADAYTQQLAYAQRRLAAMESIHDAANTWSWEVAP